MQTIKVPHYADLYTAGEWARDVELGALTPYDGSGYWASAAGFFDMTSDAFDDRPEWATHVAWFNK